MNNSKKLALMLAALLCTTSMTAPIITSAAEEETESAADAAEGTAKYDEMTEADLPVEPVKGANPDYDYFTTINFVVVLPFGPDGVPLPEYTYTVSAKDDFTQFEILGYWDQTLADNKVIVVKNGDDYDVIVDRIGHMSYPNTSPELIRQAVAADIWVPVDKCSVEYVDPAEKDLDMDYWYSFVWDNKVEPTNPNLKDLPFNVFDETVRNYKRTPAEVQGEVVPLEYDTYFYAKDAADGDVNSHNTPIKKTAYVYLPAGYDASSQYNVLYLLHGGGDDAAKWFSECDNDQTELGKGYAVNLLDNMFANGEAEPCIIVTPGMYDGEGFRDVETAMDFTSENFNLELEDLMAVVESTYSTYAEDTSKEGLIASRDHRALAGLSMGSITTWKSGIDKAIDLFSWFANMSGGPSADEAEATAYIESNVIPALEKAAADGYKINMMLHFNGANDMARAPHAAANKVLEKFAETSDIITQGENYDFIMSNGDHNFFAWNLYLYDMLHVFFK